MQVIIWDIRNEKAPGEKLLQVLPSLGHGDTRVLLSLFLLATILFLHRQCLKKYFRDTRPNILDPNQAQYFVGSDLGPNCF